jgi:hypothetical protein
VFSFPLLKTIFTLQITVSVGGGGGVGVSDTASDCRLNKGDRTVFL